MTPLFILILGAVLTAAILIPLADPLMRDPARRKFGVLLLALGAISALGLYLALGDPAAQSHPAAFESADNPRAQIRQRQQMELILLQALSAEPDNTALLLQLGTVQIETGRPRDAIPHLTRAHELKPGDSDISTALAAAIFANALMIAGDGKPGAAGTARRDMEKSLSLLPKSHPMRADITRAIQSLR